MDSSQRLVNPTVSFFFYLNDETIYFKIYRVKTIGKNFANRYFKYFKNYRSHVWNYRFVRIQKIRIYDFQSIIYFVFQEIENINSR